MSSPAPTDRSLHDEEDGSYQNDDDGVKASEEDDDVQVDDTNDGDWEDEAGEPGLFKHGRKKRRPLPYSRTLHLWNGNYFPEWHHRNLWYMLTLLKIPAGRDQLLLLAIEYICNKNSISIPWDEVAKIMTPHLSGEACKQHLTKMYLARVAHGFQVPPRHNKIALPDTAKTWYDGKEPSFPKPGKKKPTSSLLLPRNLPKQPMATAAGKQRAAASRLPDSLQTML